MKFLNLIDKSLSFINEFIAATGIAAGVLLAFVNVIARFFFHEGIDWAFELTNYLFIWSALFGAAYCFKLECHIKVLILIDLLPSHISKWLIIIAKIITLIYLLAVAYYGYIFIFDPEFGLKASGEVSVDLNVPMWIPYLVVPLAFLFASFMVFFKILYYIKKPANEVKIKSEHEMIIDETELAEGKDIRMDIK